MPSVYPAIKADTLEELARKMKLDPAKVRQTIDQYNAAIPAGQTFDNLKLDGNHTVGLTPNKTNWARSVDKGPFYGYPLRPGITFTYLGVDVTPQAQIKMKNGNIATNMFAAGEMGNDIVEIFALDMGIPIFFRVDHDVGTFLAGAETHVRLDVDVGESLGGDLLLQLRGQLLGPTGFAIDILADKAALAHGRLLKSYLLTSHSICNS